MTKKTSRVATFLFLLGVFCLPSEVSAVSIVDAETFAQVGDGINGPFQNDSGVLTATATASLPGYSSITTSVLSTLGDSVNFSVTFDQFRGGNIDSYNAGHIIVSFTLAVDATYSIDGLYLNSSGVTTFHGSLVDDTASVVLFENQQQSTLGPAAFSLGDTGGNSSNYLVGSLTGTLLAGDTYIWSISVNSAPNLSDDGAVASGSAQLLIAAVPEPASFMLLGVGGVALLMSGGGRRWRVAAIARAGRRGLPA